MIQHLDAILIILEQLAVWAFYALFAVAGVVMAINFMLEQLHKLIYRIIGRTRWPRVLKQTGYGAAEAAQMNRSPVLPARWREWRNEPCA
jgi:hypothetical protein